MVYIGMARVKSAYKSLPNSARSGLKTSPISLTDLSLAIYGAIGIYMYLRLSTQKNAHTRISNFVIIIIFFSFSSSSSPVYKRPRAKSRNQWCHLFLYQTDLRVSEVCIVTKQSLSLHVKSPVLSSAWHNNERRHFSVVLHAYFALTNPRAQTITRFSKLYLPLFFLGVAPSDCSYNTAIHR